MFGDDLGFGADGIGERLVPDLVADLVGLSTREMHLEDEWVAVAYASASRGQMVRGGLSSLVAWWRYYADLLNMPIDR